MEAILENMNSAITASLTGTVAETIGMTVSVSDFPAPVGAVVRIERDDGAVAEGEVVGFRDGHTLLYLLGATAGVRRGNRVRLLRTSHSLKVGPALLSRVINAHGQCIDGRPQPVLPTRVRIDRQPTLATERPRITAPL